MKRVCFLTNYFDYLKSFSPLILTEDQIKMFLKAGYKPLAIVTEGFTPPDDSYFNKIELRMIHNVFRDDDTHKDKSFEDDVKMLAFEIDKHLKDIDVVITHDLLYMPDYTKYNLAARMVASSAGSLNELVAAVRRLVAAAVSVIPVTASLFAAARNCKASVP